MLDANVAIIGRDEGDYKVAPKDYRNVGKVKLFTFSIDLSEDLLTNTQGGLHLLLFKVL